MKKFMSIAMTAIAGICLLSMVGCGKKLEVKMKNTVPAKSIKFYVNGDDWLPFGIQKKGQVTPRINVTYMDDYLDWRGEKYINIAIFTVKGLTPGDVIHMEIDDVAGQISEKVEVKNQKKVVFREWRRK